LRIHHNLSAIDLGEMGKSPPIRFGFPRRWLSTWLVLVCCAVAGSLANAEVIEDFESPETSWTYIQADGQLQIAQHERTTGEAHMGTGSEMIALRTGSGTHVYFVHPVTPSRVIPDLRFSVWLKGNKAGVQLMARVVFPRSLDPTTGLPRTSLLLGESYQTVGKWSRLTLRDPATAVEQQVPALRSEYGSRFDPREAYIDQVVLNLYTGKGTNTLYIDDLEAEGQLTVHSGTAERQAEVRQSAPTMPNPTQGARVHLSRSSQDEDVGSVANGQVVEINGHAAVPRILDYHGEPISLLRQLGVTAIRTSEPPGPRLRQELARHGLTSVSSPPNDYEPRDQQSVLAWELPATEGEDAFSDFVIRAEEVKLLDGNSPRPVMAIPPSRVFDYSRHSEIVTARRGSIATSGNLDRYHQWLNSWSLFSSPSTIRWAAIPTQVAPTTTRQVAALARDPEMVAGIDATQIEKAAFLALASGSRGLLFESSSPLSIDHPADANRRAAIALVNRRINLIQPWVSAGRFVSDVSVNDPNVRVSMLATPTSILLIAVRVRDHDQLVTAEVPEHNITIRARGIPAASEPYLLSDTGLPRITYHRGHGDLRITLEDKSHVSLIVLTQDPRVIRDLRRRIDEHRSDLVRLRIDLATHEFQLTRAVSERLVSSGAMADMPRSLDQAWAHLRQAERLYELGNLDVANQFARQGLQKVQGVQRRQWEQLAAQYRFPLTNPLMASYDLVPHAVDFQAALQGLRPSENRLPGGDMEDISFLLASGWTQQTIRGEGFDATVELSPNNPRGGDYSLGLSVQPDERQMYARPESAPVQVRSAAVQVEPGRLVLIRGAIRIPKPLATDSRGLSIHDSLGGRDLGLQFHQGKEWTEFSMIRATGESNTMHLIIEMEGVGQVFLDDLTIQQYEEADLVPTDPVTNPSFLNDRFQTVTSP